MNALIAGASGLVGGHLLSLLLEDSRVEQVVGVGRKALPIQHGKIRNVETSFFDLAEKPLFSADAAFCCLGTTIKKAGTQEKFQAVDHDMVLAFAKYALQNGVKKFLLVSALGANAGSSVFYNRVKGQTEKDLEALGFESLVIFQPSLLLGERTEKRFTESLAIQLYPFYRPLLLGPLAQYAPVEAKQVASAMQKKCFENTPKRLVVSNLQILKGNRI